MRSKSFEGMACSIAGVLEAIGDRWAVLILRDLSLGLARYEDLRRSTGVTNATLSDRLKHLPCIILTAAGQEAQHQKAMELGATEFLTKPFSPKKLYARTAELAGLSQDDYGAEPA